MAGHFELAPDQLARYRGAVDNETSGKQLSGIVAKLEKRGLALESFSRLTRAPKGMPADHVRVQLLTYKGLHVQRNWPAHALPKPSETVGAVTGLWLDAKPLLDWMANHVGPSTAPKGRF